MNLTISASTNRITLRRTNNCTESPNLSVGHDAAGNMTSEPGRTYQYDAENRIKSVNNGSVAVYQYDADGRRSVKNSASGTRIYFYDIEGRSIAESGPTQGGWLSGRAYFQDRHVFENTGVQFLWRHTDHLGTAVVRTDSNGGKICDSRFYPYGEEFTAPCAGDPYKFTGKERDSETGLDYFGARYYGNHYGRFTSVDPADDSDAGDPQRWNRYAYARNNPAAIVDRDGEAIETLWDIANIGIGVASLVSNLRGGNYGAAAVDAGGLVLDTAAAVVPFVLGGAGAAIKAVRAADKAADATRAADRILDTGKAAKSVREAQREAMRAERIPTSLQPIAQRSTPAGRQYTYEVPKQGGGTE